MKYKTNQEKEIESIRKQLGHLRKLHDDRRVSLIARTHYGEEIERWERRLKVMEQLKSK